MKRNSAIVLVFSLLIILLPQITAALTLTPPLLEIGVEPGREITSKIKVFNESDSTISLYPSTANFTAKDEIGTPYFLFVEEEGLASWIEITPGPIVLLPGERQDVVFNVKVPEDADPGGHYAGIFFGSAPPVIDSEAGQVTVVSKLGVLLLFRVSGDVTVRNAIQEFHILNDQKIFTRLPINFWYRLRNSGNLHIRPEGEIEIKNIFGLKTTKSPQKELTRQEEEQYKYKFVNANPIEGAVLPDSVRKFETAWKKSEPYDIENRNFFQNFISQAVAEYKNFAFGRYTASLKISNVPESLTVEKISFWVFPWHFLLLLVIVLIIAILILVLIISRYNRWIIKRAFRANHDESINSIQISPKNLPVEQNHPASTSQDNQRLENDT